MKLTIKFILKGGGKMSRIREWSKKEVEEIVDLYCVQLKGINFISKIYKSAPTTVKNLLIKKGISIRSSNEQSSIENKRGRFENRKHDLNHDYFKSWSGNMVYILGFICSDGNIFNNRIKFGIKESDKELLEKIKSEMGYTGQIFNTISRSMGKEYKSVKLDISSMDYKEDLGKLGIFDNKSLIIRMPSLPEEYELDFVRGYFDGDGFVKKGKYVRFGICSGSEGMIKDLLSKLTKHGMSERTLYKHKTANMHTFEYSSGEVNLMYSLLYGMNPDLFLRRKKEAFEDHIDCESIILPRVSNI